MKTRNVKGKDEKISYRESPVDEVNNMLTKAFGKKVEGNLRYAVSVDDTWFTPENYLRLICKIGWLGGKTPIGKFSSKNGSSFVIKPEYENEAKKYCKLYEESMGKTTTFVLGNPF